MDPMQVGELLRFKESEPTRSTVKRLKSGRVIWSIELETNENLSLEKKIEALLAEFTNDVSVWTQAMENIRADIFCGLFLDEWNQGFELTSKLLKELADRNVKIGFDIYAP